jgi:hypothetical protein
MNQIATAAAWSSTKLPPTERLGSVTADLSALGERQVVPNEVIRTAGSMRDAMSGVMVTWASFNGPNCTLALIFLLIHFSPSAVSVTSPRGTKPTSSSWREPSCDFYRATRYKSSIGFSRYRFVPPTKPALTSNWIRSTLCTAFDFFNSSMYSRTCCTVSGSDFSRSIL